MKKRIGYILMATVISVIAALSFYFSSGIGGKADADHSSRQNDSEAVESSLQKSDNGLTDKEIKERILDKRFCFDKIVGKDARGYVIEIIHEMYFWKGGTGMSRFKELDNTHGIREVSKEPFSWKVSGGEIYVTHANSLKTEVFTFKPAEHILANDHIIDCSSGNEYSGH